MRSMVTSALALGLLAFAGCGGGFSGTYEDDAGVTRYAFDGEGGVRITVLGSEVAAEYRLDGDKVLVSSAQGTVVLTVREENLYGPMGLELKRQSR